MLLPLRARKSDNFCYSLTKNILYLGTPKIFLLIFCKKMLLSKSYKFASSNRKQSNNWITLYIAISHFGVSNNIFVNCIYSLYNHDLGILNTLIFCISFVHFCIAPHKVIARPSKSLIYSLLLPRKNIKYR